ncbi:MULTISPECIES: hypothetical protein [unclassified Bradyrhizobium]|uniref:hypothetical protein n=1 Tax=unclassified Bradyrhizobium TaxID=2631580 RepID=UPI0020B2B4B0|nr:MULTISPECIES: hypothetical protein [unclassified Bradyrhizobium]MCP3397756.1 hypothetical protein [Bradyrhizobium sp. CCGB20]MCP3406346.1 hypothetical protein [Bradyrhizobium sp. CCGB01]
MKHVEARPYADPEAAARKLVELAASIEPVQDGRIYIERINAPFLFTLNASGSEFGAGIRYAVDRGWLMLHESGTYVKLLPLGEDLLAR